MKIKEDKVGRCLTRYRREDYLEVQSKYTRFLHVTQWDTRYTKNTTKMIKDSRDTVINNDSRIYEASSTYGLAEDGITLEYLGSVIDSSD
jgi:hypothetical protein